MASDSAAEFDPFHFRDETYGLSDLEWKVNYPGKLTRGLRRLSDFLGVQMDWREDREQLYSSKAIDLINYARDNPPTIEVYFPGQDANGAIQIGVSGFEKMGQAGALMLTWLFRLLDSSSGYLNRIVEQRRFVLDLSPRNAGFAMWEGSNPIYFMPVDSQPGRLATPYERSPGGIILPNQREAVDSSLLKFSGKTGAKLRYHGAMQPEIAALHVPR